jgi:hypothetical protein
MNYRIVGSDGKVYGPVAAEQIRQWLAAGRAENRTPVYVAGASEWTTIGALPEFTAPPAATPPTMAPVRPARPPASGTNGFATAGLICGLLSWICCCCQFVSLLGLIFSIIALVQISSQTEKQEGRLLAILGLVLSGTNLGFSLIFVLLQMLFGNNTLPVQGQQFFPPN